MILYLIRKKMLFIFAKEGPVLPVFEYYDFAHNVRPSLRNEKIATGC